METQKVMMLALPAWPILNDTSLGFRLRYYASTTVAKAGIKQVEARHAQVFH